MAILAALLAGLMFGLGLVVAAMVDPAKVIGFLDIAGDWDPSLALVMAGAIPVATLGFALGRGRSRPLLAAAFHPPGATGIDRPLLRGAALFGVGWGLAGFCPGPARPWPAWRWAPGKAGFSPPPCWWAWRPTKSGRCGGSAWSSPARESAAQAKPTARWRASALSAAASPPAGH